MQKLIILLIIGIAALAGYWLHLQWKKMINPRKSFGYFILYMLLHFASIFLLIFLINLIMIRNANFLFNK